MSNVRIGIIQMSIKVSSFGKRHKTENLKRAKELVSELLAKEKDIDLIVLPEEFYSGSSYNFTNIPCSINELEDKVLKDLKKLAEENKCYIIGSVIVNNNEKGTEDKRYENLGFIIDRNGEILGYQGKFHVFEDEAEYIKPESNYNIFNLDIGRVGIVLGMDVFYPEIARNLTLQGAEIIIAPSLIPKLKDKDSELENQIFVDLAKQSVIASAMQNQVFFVYVNALGNSIYVDGEFVGESLVSSPLGRTIFIGYEEKIQVVEVDKSEIDTAKKIISLLNIRNKEAYILGEKVHN